MGAPSDPFDLVGALIERKYRVDRVVAEGGFGVVYAGYHLGIEAKVAIKVLRPVEAFDVDTWMDAMAQFRTEAKAIAKIRHPAVVGVLDAGIAPTPKIEGGVPWMVLEWLDGETLEAHLAARRGEGGTSRAQCLTLLRPVFEAIAAAHAIGITHRDLKPSNIMLVRGDDDRTSARVLDFGIAKILGDEPRTTTGETTTDASSRAFSAVCAAPEQLAGTRTGPWTDVYALALLVTEVLCDRAPYPESDPSARYEAVFDARRRPTPAKLDVDAGAWEAVLERALAVRPNERHADAGELLADLERTVDGVKVTPLAPALPASLRTRVRRPAWVATYALAVLAAGGAIAIRARTPTTKLKELSSSASPAACAGHRTCIERANGRPSACTPEGRCIELASPDCTVLADDRALHADDTIWFGSMFPVTGAEAQDFGLGNVHAIDLARRDFVGTMTSLATQRAGDAARPFGVVSCDDGVDARRAARHLVDVGVPAVIGFRSGAETIDLSTGFFLPKGIATICATSTNPLVTRVPQPDGMPRLVWRTTYGADATAAALASFLASEIEPAVGPGGMRVALVRQNNPVGSAVADAFAREVRIGGKSAAFAGDAYKNLALDLEAPDAGAQSTALTDALLEMRPSAVVLIGGREVVQGVLAPLEKRWPAGSRRPVYASIALIGSNLLEFVGNDRELGRRVFGVTPVSTSPTNARFVAHYNEAFPDEHVTPTNAPNTAYDAFYALAYAAYALRGEPVTGRSLASAFAKLVLPGRKIEVGIRGIFDAYGELSAGHSIDLVGATGDLDFDLATGEAPFDQAILCVAYDAAGRAVDGVPSGLVYTAADRRMTGKLRCR